MPVDTPRDLFRHELKDIYDAEHRFLDALREMKGHVTDTQLKEGFDRHMGETEDQIERLDKVFRSLNEQPKRATCHGAKGLIEEHDAFMKEKPGKEVSNLYHVGAALKTERYEIVAYESLVNLAKQLGLDEARELLQENLDEEKRMAEKLKEIEQRVAPMKSGR